MRRLLLLPVVLFVVLPLRAEQPAKANTLTPKEVADGWLLLFDGETTFGWHAVGDVKVRDGTVTLRDGATLTSTSPFSYYTLRVEFRPPPDAATITLDRQRWRFMNFGGGDWPQYQGPDGWVASEWNLVPEPELPGGSASHRLKGWYGPAKTGIPFGSTRLSWNRGPISFSVSPGDTLTLRSIKLKPYGLAPLFNGKDLTSWKEFPGRKSKFTVTPEGWLNIKDGPGDLQTEDQWDDFIAQLDCISNGKHLNSGVFFRCRPGEYQQGYEAQIRNQFTEKPTQEYALDEYDPETHQLKGKKKEKYAAVDYGTGAIYRRQPARRQVAKDNEWFTLTIAAQGRHFASWVNGVQVADWTDHRPLQDNARQGCYLKKGPLSLQGHDPTTDLSFRNLRAVALPPEKD